MDVEYSSNNSGGSWWLSDQNWSDLEAAGWEVHWVSQNPRYEGEKRFLGALAKHATKRDTTLKQAIAEWEDITGKSRNALGCSCCGAPHSFTLYDGENYVDSYYPLPGGSGDAYDGD